MGISGADMDVAQEAARMFQTFMTATLRLGELQKLGCQLLTGYQHELDLFRRPSLLDSSAMVANIFASNPSPRLLEYKEAGCRHLHTDRQVVLKLDAFLRGLQDHIQQARESIEELRCLVERVTCMMHDDLNRMLCDKANLSTLQFNPEDCNSEQVSIIEDSYLVNHGISDYAILMSAILSMLEQDFQMQEKIVTSLGLDTPSEPLQNYCLMWTLRPFVEERVIDAALSRIGK